MSTDAVTFRSHHEPFNPRSFSHLREERKKYVIVFQLLPNLGLRRDEGHNTIGARLAENRKKYKLSPLRSLLLSQDYMCFPLFLLLRNKSQTFAAIMKILISENAQEKQEEVTAIIIKNCRHFYNPEICETTRRDINPEAFHNIFTYHNIS